MSDQTNNGGPAFPRPASTDRDASLAAKSQEGMTLLDCYYAAVAPAVAEIFLNRLALFESTQDEQVAQAAKGEILQECSELALDLAAAMVAAREARK